MTDDMQPTIVHAAEHGIKRAQLDRNALSVVTQLQRSGYAAYLVGGCIRDLLNGVVPKDYDVATNATPEQIRSCFRRGCRLIGRRFRLAHIRFGREIIEVATFRGNGRTHEDDKGRLLSENVYGPIHEDAARRDFTVNAMFFDPTELVLLDYHGGYEDARNRRLRLIGDPESRYREDPVRLLRAIRFAAKLDFSIDAESEAPLAKMGHLLADVPPARLFDESLKLFLSGHAAQSLAGLRHYDLYSILFPDAGPALSEDDGMQAMTAAAMDNTDERIAQDRPTTPAFLFAVLLWPGVVARTEEHLANGMKFFQAREQAADQIIRRQIRRVSIPRRFTVPMREIWQLQGRFRNRRGKRAQRLFTHPRFRAAYDFLLLRNEAEPDLTELARYWTELQEVDADERRKRLAGETQGRKSKRQASGSA